MERALCSDANANCTIANCTWLFTTSSLEISSASISIDGIDVRSHTRPLPRLDCAGFFFTFFATDFGPGVARSAFFDPAALTFLPPDPERSDSDGLLSEWKDGARRTVQSHWTFSCRICCNVVPA